MDDYDNLTDINNLDDDYYHHNSTNIHYSKTSSMIVFAFFMCLIGCTIIICCNKIIQDIFGSYGGCRCYCKCKKKLPKVVINDFINIDIPHECKKDICSICIEEYGNDKQLVKLGCNHIYHRECIEEWVNNYNNQCPLCRGIAINRSFKV